MALYRGSGGAVFEITPPEPGTPARELFDGQIARGDLALIEEQKKPAARGGRAKAQPDPEQAPESTED